MDRIVIDDLPKIEMKKMGMNLSKKKMNTSLEEDGWRAD